MSLRDRDAALQGVAALIRRPRRPAPEPPPPRSAIQKPRPFAGEVDPPAGAAPAAPAGAGKGTSVAGYMGFLPGTAGAFGLNYQQVLKTAEHFRAGLSGGRRCADRAIPDRLVDRWGNMKRKNVETVSQTANLYLRALDPGADIDMQQGVGKAAARRTVAEVPEGYYKRDQAARVQVPFVVRKKPAAPGRVVGYTGHRPGAREARQMTFNRIEMMSHPKYARAPNYEEMSLLVDKVPTIPASETGGSRPGGIVRPQTAPSFFLSSPIGRRTWAKDFIPAD